METPHAPQRTAGDADGRLGGATGRGRARLHPKAMPNESAIVGETQTGALINNKIIIKRVVRASP